MGDTAAVDTTASQPEENRLRDVLGVRHDTGYAVSSLEDTCLVCSKQFLKLCVPLRHHEIFYRGRQASLLGSPIS
jgi:hypothetical protein